MEKRLTFKNSKKNPYAQKISKKQITIRIDEETVNYFKKLASERDMPYQTLINSYLMDCAQKHLKPEMIYHEEDKSIHKTNKKQITIRIDGETINYFKKLASKKDTDRKPCILYQTLMNSYLMNCTQKRLKPEMVWE